MGLLSIHWLLDSMDIAMERGNLVCLSFRRQGWINIDAILEPVWSAEELILPTGDVCLSGSLTSRQHHEYVLNSWERILVDFKDRAQGHFEVPHVLTLPSDLMTCMIHVGTPGILILLTGSDTTDRVKNLKRCCGVCA
jgi:hypothetical protein